MSLMSMTAFGTGESSGERFLYNCEIKTLNSRFMDINVRIPRSMGALESLIITEVKKSLIRGKVDISFEITSLEPAASLPKLNEAAISYYASLSKKINEIAAYSPKELSVYELLRLEGSLESLGRGSKLDAVTIHKEGVLASLSEALKKVKLARAAEGAALLPVFQDLLGVIKQERLVITKQTEQIREHMFSQQKKKLEQFLQRLGDLSLAANQKISEDRVQTELVIMADKSDIAEELARLEGHENEFLKILGQGKEVGRKLDFLCQELHREINTISSKVSQLEVSRHTLNVKQAVERLRQQIQNIE